MGSFASLSAAEIRLRAKLEDPTWLNGHTAQDGRWRKPAFGVSCKPRKGITVKSMGGSPGNRRQIARRMLAR